MCTLNWNKERGRGICKPQARELQLKPAHHFARARLKIALVEYIIYALWLYTCGALFRGMGMADQTMVV